MHHCDAEASKLQYVRDPIGEVYTRKERAIVNIAFDGTDGHSI